MIGGDLMKLFKLLALVFCLASLSMTACSNTSEQKNVVRRPVRLPIDFPNVDNQIYGTWVSSEPVAQQNGVAVWFLLYFNQSSVAAVSAQCGFADGDLIATARIAVRITGTSLDLLQPAEQTEYGPNNERCNVNVKTGSFMYQVITDSLQLVELSSNSTIKFSRMR